MLRTFKHAVTGRSMQVRKDSRTERLVEADENWTEVKPQKEASDDGSGNAGGRRSAPRKGRNSSGGRTAS